MASSYWFRANPTVLHTVPPPFPPPLSSQPPDVSTIQRAILSPPFVWKGIPLRSFRYAAGGDLSTMAPLEEKGRFINVPHQKRYQSLKKNLHHDLEDLSRRHKVENKLESAIRVAVEEREITDFHEDFTKRLEWGEESSSLLLGHDMLWDIEALEEEGASENRAAGQVQNSQERVREDPQTVIARFSEMGQGSPFPSVRKYFRHYPEISISLTVADFYRRLEKKREEFGNALEFQQMWEWSERHWNFFEAVSHLRDWARSYKASGNWKREDPEVASNNPASDSQDDAGEANDENEGETAIEWSHELETRKRRHQWAILQRIMAAFEINEEDFPEISAPAGRTLDSYFALGRYGLDEKWYPVDPELEGKGKGGIKEAMKQIDCFEDVLATGGTLAQACMAVIRRNQERDSRVTTDDASVTSGGDPDGSGEQTSKQQGSVDQAEREPQRPPFTEVTGDGVSIGEGPPDPLDDSNGNVNVNTRVFISSLRDRLIGGAPQPEAHDRRVQGWFESWRNPKVHIRPLLKP